MIFKNHVGAGEMALWEGVLATKIDDPCLIPGIHIVGESQLLQVVLGSSGTVVHSYLHTNAYTLNKYM